MSHPTTPYHNGSAYVDERPAVEERATVQAFTGLPFNESEELSLEELSPEELSSEELSSSSEGGEDAWPPLPHSRSFLPNISNISNVGPSAPRPIPFSTPSDDLPGSTHSHAEWPESSLASQAVGNRPGPTADDSRRVWMQFTHDSSNAPWSSRVTPYPGQARLPQTGQRSMTQDLDLDDPHDGNEGIGPSQGPSSWQTQQAPRAAVSQTHGRKRRREEVSLEDVTLGHAPQVRGHGYARRDSTGPSPSQEDSGVRVETDTRAPPQLLLDEHRYALRKADILPEALRLELERAYANHLNKLPSIKSSLLPSLHLFLSSSLVFMSELLPRSFDVLKRLTILGIFRTKATYVPACVSMAQHNPSVQYHVHDHAPHLKSNATLSPPHMSHKGWPSDQIPVEIFHKIASFLPRDCLQDLRLVNHEFERNLSSSIFRNVVVPFGPQIWNLIVHDSTNTKPAGKCNEDDHLERLNSQDKDVHDGMKVFQAWGPHIKQFAMAFDVDEEQLCNAPVKDRFESLSTFWGNYQWPHPYYSRFMFCAGLEKKADEIRAMTAALSNLQEVRALGLSVDSGLGWLRGPDISDRAQLLQEKSRIFGAANPNPDSAVIERRNTWKAMTNSYPRWFVRGSEIDGANGVDVNDEGLYHADVYNWVDSSFGPQRNVLFASRSAPEDCPLIFQGKNVRGDCDATPNISSIDDLTQMKDAYPNPFVGYRLVPSRLTAPQKEWLLETEWAQRAFLSSYCVALTDNSQTFQHVQSLTVAKLSSRYLPTLHRQDVWKALPKLEKVKIIVSADWRDICKAESGAVQAEDIQPSTAATQFDELLKTTLAPLKGIKTLTVGYIGGGEQQGGIYGRNRFLLPAPVSDYSDPATAVSFKAEVSIFPHVEHLTLENCWITPSMLRSFVTKMRAASLQTLTLNSVSLTAQADNAEDRDTDVTGCGSLHTTPQGPPRYNDPAIGNLFEQRALRPEPSLHNRWLTQGSRVGSWANVMNAITPGPTRELLRYAYQYLDDAPRLHDSGSLQRIEFVSCGYVKLKNMKNFPQAFLGFAEGGPPGYLGQRALDLMPVMMHRPGDQLLGTLITYFSESELESFRTEFPMDIGWKSKRKYQNYEDGRAPGGSGRFSGYLEKLVFPPGYRSKHLKPSNGSRLS